MHTHITHTLTLHTHIPAFVTLVTPIGLPCSPCYSLSSHMYQSQLLDCLLNEIFLFQNWYDLPCTLSTPQMCTVTSMYSQLHPHTHHYTRTYVPSHLPLRHPLRVTVPQKRATSTAAHIHPFCNDLNDHPHPPLTIYHINAPQMSCYFLWCHIHSNPTHCRNYYPLSIYCHT